MFERNDKKTDKAKEMRGALNALHNARAEIRATHPERSPGVEVSMEGKAVGLLALYSAISQNLLEVLTEQANLPPLVAAKAIADAAGRGLAGTYKK